MSNKGLQEFIQKMKTDNKFYNHILAIEDVSERLAAIKSEGFEFTEDELSNLKQFIMKYSKGKGKDKDSELKCCISVPYYYL